MDNKQFCVCLLNALLHKRHIVMVSVFTVLAYAILLTWVRVSEFEGRYKSVSSIMKICMSDCNASFLYKNDTINLADAIEMECKHSFLRYYCT